MTKAVLYIITLPLSLYALQCIDFEKIIRKNTLNQTKILLLFLSIIMSYALTNFIFDFLENTRFFSSVIV